MTERQQLEFILRTRVDPVLERHGGSVRLVDWDGATVLVELSGACSGCPSADLSTRSFIGDTLRDACPGVARVELHRTVPADLLEAARRLLGLEKPDEAGG